MCITGSINPFNPINPKAAPLGEPDVSMEATVQLVDAVASSSIGAVPNGNIPSLPLSQGVKRGRGDEGELVNPASTKKQKKIVPVEVSDLHTQKYFNTLPSFFQTRKKVLHEFFCFLEPLIDSVNKKRFRGICKAMASIASRARSKKQSSSDFYTNSQHPKDLALDFLNLKLREEGYGWFADKIKDSLLEELEDFCKRTFCTKTDGRKTKRPLPRQWKSETPGKTIDKHLVISEGFLNVLPDWCKKSRVATQAFFKCFEKIDGLSLDQGAFRTLCDGMTINFSQVSIKKKQKIALDQEPGLLDRLVNQFFSQMKYSRFFTEEIEQSLRPKIQEFCEEYLLSRKRKSALPQYQPKWKKIVTLARAGQMKTLLKKDHLQEGEYLSMLPVASYRKSPAARTLYDIFAPIHDRLTQGQFVIIIDGIHEACSYYFTPKNLTDADYGNADLHRETANLFMNHLVEWGVITKEEGELIWNSAHEYIIRTFFTRRKKGENIAAQERLKNEEDRIKLARKCPQYAKKSILKHLPNLEKEKEIACQAAFSVLKQRSQQNQWQQRPGSNMEELFPDLEVMFSKAGFQLSDAEKAGMKEALIYTPEQYAPKAGSHSSGASLSSSSSSSVLASYGMGSKHKSKQSVSKVRLPSGSLSSLATSSSSSSSSSVLASSGMESNSDSAVNNKSKRSVSKASSYSSSSSSSSSSSRNVSSAARGVESDSDSDDSDASSSSSSSSGSSTSGSHGTESDSDSDIDPDESDFKSDE